MNYSLEDNLIETRRGSVRLRRSAKGMPPVFWPSIYMDGQMWEPVANALLPDYDVIFIDPLGHGNSDPVTMQECTNLVADIVQTLDVGPATLVGWRGRDSCSCSISVMMSGNLVGEYSRAAIYDVWQTLLS